MPEFTMSRRSAIGLLLGSAVLPPVVGRLPHAAAAPVTGKGSLLTDAARRLDKPNLAFTKAAQIQNAHHRVTFWKATWDDGSTYVRDIEVRDARNRWVPLSSTDRRFDEQWVIHQTGTPGHPHAHPHWVGFRSCRTLSRTVVELTAGDPEVGELVVRWDLSGTDPELQYTFTAAVADDFVISHSGWDVTDLDGVDEVLCGAIQHALVVRSDPQPRGSWELFWPMALTQRQIDGQTWTLGTFIPAEVMLFEHGHKLGEDRQPYGMTLRNDSLDIAPTVYEPQPGLRAAMTAGQSRGFAFGLCVRPGTLGDVAAELLHDEYDYAPYRHNVYDTSLTGAIHNMNGLMAIEPDGDDSEAFVPSFSGWWSRAKGFMNVEIVNDIRVSAGGVLLASDLLTSDGEDTSFHDRRARPMAELYLSRGSIAYSPIAKAGQNPNQHRLGYVAGDAVSLNALAELTHGLAGGIRTLGAQAIAEDLLGRDRPRFLTAMGAFHLTGDPSHLREAELLALDYIATEIDQPYTDVPVDGTFAYTNSRFWADLVVLWEHTGNEQILAGAHREATRFITQTMVRPVPESTVTVGEPPVVEHAYDWPSNGLADYPRTELDIEQVPAWLVSTSGLTYEQLVTLKTTTSGSVNSGGGYVTNPCWAGLLLRLSHHTGDQLLADLAHNSVIGRFTNYPGYYSREFQVAQLKPDYPLLGPAGISAIYPHHIPAQLGLAMDYLFSEQLLRSGGEVSFPGVYEANYVYFKYTLYGHRPGTVYGEDGVWPWIPRGLISVGSPLLNWVTGVGNSSLYVSLVNTSNSVVETTVDLATGLTGLSAEQQVQIQTLSAAGRPSRTVAAGTVEVTVPPRGIVTFAVRDVELARPWHRLPDFRDTGATSFHTTGPAPGVGAGGLVRGILLPRPERTGYDAYVLADTLDAATLEYRIGDGDWQSTGTKPYPNEWTITVDDLTATFTYRVRWSGTTTEPVTLAYGPELTGASGLVGQVDAPATTVVQGEFDLTVPVRADDQASVVVVPMVPSGWTVTPTHRTITVGPEVVRPSFTVTPTGVIGEQHTLGASVDGVPVGEATITVRDPRRLVGLTASTTLLDSPGQEITVTAAVANPGVVAMSAPLRLEVPAGWDADDAAATVTVPAGEIVRHSFTLTATSAAWGSSATIAVTLDETWRQAMAVKIATEPTVVHVESPWPSYQETGPWRLSGLAGWGGTRSKYNLDGLTGATARWVPNLTDDGLYEVSLWWPMHAASTKAARFVLRHNGGEETVVIDQTDSGDQWHSIGYFELSPGNGDVFLVVGDDQNHRTSAVRWRPVDDSDALASIGVADAQIAAPGGSTSVAVTVTAPAVGDLSGEVILALPAGWTCSPLTQPVTLAAGASGVAGFEVTAPSSAQPGLLHQLVATLTGGREEVSAQATVLVGELDPASLVIVDNDAGAPAYVEVGAWGRSNISGHNGVPTTRWIAPATAGTATWTPALPGAGRYRVSAWYPSEPNNAQDAIYTVTTATGQSAEHRDQRQGSRWEVLGVWDLDPATARIVLSGADAGRLRADAVRFEQMQPATTGGSQEG